jgi:hypothetical protein
VNSGGSPDFHGRPARGHLKGMGSKARISSLPNPPKPKRKPIGLKRGVDRSHREFSHIAADIFLAEANCCLHGIELRQSGRWGKAWWPTARLPHAPKKNPALSTWRKGGVRGDASWANDTARPYTIWLRDLEASRHGRTTVLALHVHPGVGIPTSVTISCAFGPHATPAA